MRPPWIGRANFVLGAVSLIRLATEFLFLWPPNDRAQLGMFLPFDATVASGWVLSGLFLRSRHEWALSTTAAAAGAAAARTIISGMLLAPRMAGRLWDLRDDPQFEHVLCAVFSRFLHYAIEFIYWPVVLFLILKAAEEHAPRGQPHTERSTGIVFATAGMIAAITLVVLIDPLT